MSEQNKAKSGWKAKPIILILVVVALVAAFKYFNVQQLLKNALDWISGLGPSDTTSPERSMNPAGHAVFFDLTGFAFRFRVGGLGCPRRFPVFLK